MVALIRDYHRAVRHNRIARFCLMAQTAISDPKIKIIIQELVLQDGCWELTIQVIRQNQLFDKESYEKLRKWAAEKRELKPA